MLTATPQTHGYLRVKLSQEAKVKDCYVHRLVAAAFIGPPLADKPQVNHKDGNKKNNTVANLEYVSDQENKDHAVLLGLAPKGEKAGRAKLTEREVRQIRKLLKSRSRQTIADTFGVHYMTITCIDIGKTWTCVK